MSGTIAAGSTNLTRSISFDAPATREGRGNAHDVCKPVLPCTGPQRAHIAATGIPEVARVCLRPEPVAEAGDGFDQSHGVSGAMGAPGAWAVRRVSRSARLRPRERLLV